MSVEGNSAEVAVGQKWLLGIGVLILIIGVGFFLKYAFDQQWIGPAVRISIGFICGLLLLLGGNLCRQRNLRGLDVGIGAVGLGTLYLTSYAASQVDRFLPASLTLVLILLTTAVGVSLAILWASQALAILAFLGGYLAPLLFASALFDRWLFLGYLLILTLGGQILAYARNWRPLYSSGAVWTWLSIVVWSQRDYRKEWFLETLVFTQVLFVAYSVMPFLRAAVRKESSWSQGFLLAVVNGLFCCWYSDSLLNYEKSSGSLVTLSYAIVSLEACIGVLARQRTSQSSIELAHRTRHHFPARLLGTGLQQLLGDCFLVGRARGALLGCGEVHGSNAFVQVTFLIGSSYRFSLFCRCKPMARFLDQAMPCRLVYGRIF